MDVKFKDSRVLFLCTTDNMIWQFLIPHIQDLQSYGAKVTCVCNKTGFWFDELRDKFGFDMVELKMERKPLNLTNLKAYGALKKMLKQQHHDIVYCQQPTGGLLGRFIGKKFKLKVIYTAHGFFFFKGNSVFKNLIFKAAEKYMARHTDVLITMNDEDYLASLKWKADKKYKINGIGLDLDKYQTTQGTNLKKQLNVKENTKVILSVSEFIKRKNYEGMLKAIAELKKVRQDFVYVVCGTGQLFDEMKALAKTLQIEDVVAFLGYRKDINQIMQQSDVFFHQSFHEGLTMGIMEAMYFSLPVVCSNVRGNKDLIDDSLGGMITSPQDTAAQVEALNNLLSNKALCQSMGQYNNQKVKDYSLQSVQKQLNQIYKENNLI